MSDTTTVQVASGLESTTVEVVGLDEATVVSVGPERTTVVATGAIGPRGPQGLPGLPGLPQVDVTSSDFGGLPDNIRDMGPQLTAAATYLQTISGGLGGTLLCRSVGVPYYFATSPALPPGMNIRIKGDLRKGTTFRIADDVELFQFIGNYDIRGCFIELEDFTATGSIAGSKRGTCLFDTSAEVITITGTPSSGGFTLSLNTEAVTTPLTQASSADDVQEALRSLVSTVPGADSIIVTGPVGGPWRVRFPDVIFRSFLTRLTIASSDFNNAARVAVANPLRAREGALRFKNLQLESNRGGSWWMTLGNSVYYAKFENIRANNHAGVIKDGWAADFVMDEVICNDHDGGRPALDITGGSRGLLQNGWYSYGAGGTGNVPDIVIRAAGTQTGGLLNFIGNKHGGESEVLTRPKIQCVTPGHTDWVVTSVRITGCDFNGSSNPAVLRNGGPMVLPAIGQVVPAWPVDSTVGWPTSGTFTTTLNDATTTTPATVVTATYTGTTPSSFTGLTFDHTGTVNNLTRLVPPDGVDAYPIPGQVCFDLQNPALGWIIDDSAFTNFGTLVNDVFPGPFAQVEVGASYWGAGNRIIQSIGALSWTPPRLVMFTNGGRGFAEVASSGRAGYASWSGFPRIRETRYVSQRLKQSEHLDTAPWVDNGVTATAYGGADPMGGAAAWTLSRDGSTSTQDRYQSFDMSNMVDAAGAPAAGTNGRVYFKIWAMTTSTTATLTIVLKDSTTGELRSFPLNDLPTSWGHRPFVIPLNGLDITHLYSVRLMPGTFAPKAGTVVVAFPQISDDESDYLPTTSTSLVRADIGSRLQRIEDFGAGLQLCDSVFMFAGTVFPNDHPIAATAPVPALYVQEVPSGATTIWTNASGTWLPMGPGSGLGTRAFLVPARPAMLQDNGAPFSAVGAPPDATPSVSLLDGVITGGFFLRDLPMDLIPDTPLFIAPVWVPQNTVVGNSAVRWQIDVLEIADGVDVTTAGTTTVWTGRNQPQLFKQAIYEVPQQALASVSPGNLVRVDIRRIGNDAHDTYTDIAQLLGIRVIYSSSI